MKGSRSSPALARFPLIGVVTPVRNRRRWSVEFVRRFFAQDYPFFRLYVVDSDSTDGTPEAIAALGLDGVEVLAAPPSAYWTAATNIGVRRALADGCDYVLTINDDAIAPEDFVSSIVGAAESAGARIVGSVISYADEPAKLWGVGAYNDWASGAFVQTRLANLPEEALKGEPDAPVGLVRADYLCGNGTLVHRSVFEEIGLYDERHTPHYHADTELTMRAEQAGIARWVALDARLYNRFTEDADGALAAKNMRFFSLRSANYVRPLLYVLARYCPTEFRIKALVRYFARYLPGMDQRARSKLLRAIRLLASDARDVRVRDFAPPGDDDLGFAADIDILLSLPHAAFVMAVYAVLLRRAGDDAEAKPHLDALANGASPGYVLQQMLASAEYRAHPDSRSAFGAALVGGAHEAAELTAIQRAILAWRGKRGVLPATGELRAALGAEAATAADDRPVVCFNVDVLCMAMSDPRARTGVHRYVSCLLDAIRADARIVVRLFCSPALAAQYAALLDARPELAPLALDASERVSHGVAFYPYFPFGAKEPRLAHLPQAMTVCDLFPLTNPEWFSQQAVDSFRRQARGLIGVDHVFCISQSTEQQVRAVFPALPAATSVAWLAADAPPSAGGDMIGRLRRAFAPRYFACVATIEPRKNLGKVIEAFNLLRREDVGDLRMLVVGQEGWSVSAQALREAAAASSDRIRFLGRLPDDKLWALYRGAVCTVFPSLAEGFGLPILESFAVGAPVVTSATTSMKEIASKGAILVDPRDSSAIAGAIARIAQDKELRGRLSEEARARAADFSWLRCADAHVRIFLELCNGEGVRRRAQQVVTK